MLRQTDEWTAIKTKVEKWKERPDDFTSEAEALQMLRSLERSEEEEVRKIYDDIYSLLAYSRFKRVSYEDEMVTTWLSQVHEENSRLFQWVQLQMFIEKVKAPFLPKVFPQIRETDHGSAKKKLAEDYVAIAEHFFSVYPAVESALQKAIDLAMKTEDEQEEKLRKWLQVLESIEAEMHHVTKATKAYQQSVTGIYYSATQLNEVRTMIQRVEQLNQEWEQLLFERKKDHSSALSELQQLIGLDEVKQKVKALYRYLQYQHIRKERGFHLQDDISLNMVITGNPGTGKTILARTLAKIYHELGVLEKEEVIEVNRSQLVGGFVGQTEENTMNFIQKALGGVLFIDEAYSLKRDQSSGNDYGQTAIDTLVAAMTNKEYAGKFAVILAGYPEEMRHFLFSNPGLRSRFPEHNHIHLRDYTKEELLNIAEQIALENDFFFSEKAKVELTRRIENEQIDETFGNARTVKNIVMDAIFQKGAQTNLQQQLDYEDIAVLTEEAVQSQKHGNKEEQSPLEELQQLIGLDNVKKEVKQLTSFVRVQRIREQKGLPTVPIGLHSVFTGNPGTGKTTVARLFATALNEIGLLKRGHVIVCGRSDLVAGYIGQTAIKTKQKIREALGGVLFIDEAYSLASGGPKDFGREAIDTLVEEMTKYNENLVVILAGYPDEMAHLLQQNPGLQSRFKKHIHFPDYSPNEISEISLQYAKKYGYDINESLRNQINDKLKELSLDGNGRFAVDIVDRAIQRHANRMIEEGQQWETDALTTLKEADFIDVFNI
ncbi:AAA family ATPase [Alkalihalobacillus sp. LMS39]|uniref:AAA family ATPase n=1 Tax=Alkalihalobacillus sp. LMS39 TaxID=2924032 RepID=UPI001FB1AD02|nr:AAA family ATPase [Alkalihalobacillus sp. LMS39]UOE92642.1 AAA family ATPase [Alkalihalobacillus sp. LMS39]